MPARTDSFDLGRLNLRAGEGRKLDLEVAFPTLRFSGQDYTADPAVAALDISRMTGLGYSLRVRFATTVHGPCGRCLDVIGLPIAVDAREIEQPGSGEELSSPYVDDEVLDLQAWARDGLVLALPTQLASPLDADDRCTICQRTLRELSGEPETPEPAAPEGPDPRWAKLNEITFD